MTPMSGARGSPWPLAVATSLICGLMALGAPVGAAARVQPSAVAPARAPVTAPPRPGDGLHTPAVGVARPASPDTGPATPTTPGAQTSVAGAGTPLTIAQQNCRSSTSTAGDLQAQFDQRGPVWGGGDGAEPIPIDDGRTLWLFGDTYLGGGPYGGPLEQPGLRPQLDGRAVQRLVLRLPVPR